MGKVLSQAGLLPLAEIPGWTTNATAVCVSRKPGDSLNLSCFHVAALHKMSWCPRPESWEHNKSCKGTKTVIMLPQEVSVCGECFSGFQHQQNPPHWCGSALPHHCYLSSKIKVTITPHFPWGSSNKLMNCFAGNNSVKIKQQTNKPKRRKEDELIRSDARIEQLISWLQIQSTKHPICWIICPRLRHHAWHCPSSLQEASHGCVFLWFSTPVWLKTLALRNWHFVEWKEHSTKFVLGET